MTALVHLNLKHFEGGQQAWKGTFDNMAHLELTNLSLESCTYNRHWLGSDRREEDPDNVRETMLAGLSQLKQLHLDLEPDFHLDSMPLASRVLIVSGSFGHHDVVTVNDAAYRASEWHLQWQQLLHKIDLLDGREFYCSLLEISGAKMPKELQISKHSQHWIGGAVQQRSKQNRRLQGPCYGSKRKCQQLRCFKQKL